MVQTIDFFILFYFIYLFFYRPSSLKVAFLELKLKRDETMIEITQ